MTVKREIAAGLLAPLNIPDFELYADYYLVSFRDRNISNATQALLYIFEELNSS